MSKDMGGPDCPPDKLIAEYEASQEPELPPLKAQSGQTGKGDAAPCVAFAHNTQPNMAVRRLTPIECERLQGFPDDFTRIPWRGKEPDNCPDGPRYKALGNSMAVNCMEWIAARIQLISEMDAQE